MICKNEQRWGVFFVCVNVRPKLLIWFCGDLTLANGDPALLQIPGDPKGLSRHSMEERSDRCCHISSSSMPLLPNLAPTLKPRMKLQKMKNDAENSTEDSLKTRKTNGLVIDSES